MLVVPLVEGWLSEAKEVGVKKDSRNDSGNNGNDNHNNNDGGAVPLVMNPFRDTALKYREKWWKGTLTLPYRMKETPPLKFTGKQAPYPTIDEIEAWCNDGQKHNIGIRLAGVDAETELIGIDVDDYMKGTKKKDGGAQLAALEKELGVLPETWIATSRTDGVSGIRFFRVPRGLVFRGKADKDIEVLQKRHRYALVWPSLHPEGGIYWWFPTGIAPNKEGRKAWDGEIPDARSFPLLPEAWIEHLSNNRLIMPQDGLIDMDSSVDEVYDWATATFHGDDDSPLCTKMQEKLDKHLFKIANSSTFHDLILNAHWNLMNLAFEGHLGWNEAVNVVEREWAHAVSKRGGTTVRDVSTLNGEIFRSRIQALRQIKARVDERIKIGAQGISASCQITGGCREAVGAGPLGSTNGTAAAAGTGTGGPPTGVAGVDGSTDGDGDDPIGDVPRGVIDPIDEYARNDDGNAKLFYDLYSNITTGLSFRYVKGYGWIIWHENEDYPHWEVDVDGNLTMRRLWQEAKERQEAFANGCYGDYVSALNDFVAGLNGVTDQDVKLAKEKAKVWKDWSTRSGNNRQAEEAAKAMISLPGVSIEMNDLDANLLLLGVANGVVELTDQVVLRKAVPSDYITMNTNVAWKETDKYGKNLWNEFLDTFIPDLELRRCVQVALGYCLIGGNKERKIIVFKGPTGTGKSSIVDMVISSLGDYAQPVNHSVFQNHKLNPVLANAMGKRIIGCSEFGASSKVSNAKIKNIAGEEEIEVEVKNSNVTVKKKPNFTALIATNEVPSVTDGADEAFEQRLHIFPFDVQPENIQVSKRSLIEKTCKVAVLGWLIEGYIEYARVGHLPVAKSMAQAKSEFMSDVDEIASFRSECVEDATSPQQYISKTEMHERFKLWCRENGYQENQIMHQKSLGKRLAAGGMKTKSTNFRVNGVLNYWWIGVKFKKNRPNVIDIGKARLANDPTVVVSTQQDDGTQPPKNTL